MSSLTVGDFERYAQVRIWRDQRPEVSDAKAPRTFVTQDAATPMTPFRGFDSVEDLTGKEPRMTLLRAVERFEAAAGYRPDWALTAGADAALNKVASFTFEA